MALAASARETLGQTLGSQILSTCTRLDEDVCSLNACDPDVLGPHAAHHRLQAKSPVERRYEPVARFHLGNRAIIHKAHATADVSDKERSQSGRTMVNYLYDLPKVAQNHDAFGHSGEVVGSAVVRSLAKSVDTAPAQER